MVKINAEGEKAQALSECLIKALSRANVMWDIGVSDLHRAYHALDDRIFNPTSLLN